MTQTHTLTKLHDASHSQVSASACSERTASSEVGFARGPDSLQGPPYWLGLCFTRLLRALSAPQIPGDTVWSFGVRWLFILIAGVPYICASGRLPRAYGVGKYLRYIMKNVTPCHLLEHLIVDHRCCHQQLPSHIIDSC